MEQIRRLPHRYPFLLLDRVVRVEPGKFAVALAMLSQSTPWVEAGNGTLPVSLLPEMMAQCLGLAIRGGQDRQGMLVKIERFRCVHVPRAGDELRVEMHVRKVFGTTLKARGVVRRNGRRCAAGEIVLHLTPAEPQ